MESTDPQRPAWHGGVEGILLGSGCARGKAARGGFKRRFHRRLHSIELLPRSWLVGLFNLAHAFLNRLEPSRFGTEELDARRFERIDILCRAESRLGVGGELIEVGDEVRKSHSGHKQKARRTPRVLRARECG